MQDFRIVTCSADGLDIVQSPYLYQKYIYVYLLLSVSFSTRAQCFRKDRKVRDSSLLGALREARRYKDGISTLQANLLKDVTEAIEVLDGSRRAGALESYFALQQCFGWERRFYVTLDSFSGVVVTGRRGSLGKR